MSQRICPTDAQQHLLRTARLELVRAPEVARWNELIERHRYRGTAPFTDAGDRFSFLGFACSEGPVVGRKRTEVVNNYNARNTAENGFIQPPYGASQQTHTRSRYRWPGVAIVAKRHRHSAASYLLRLKRYLVVLGNPFVTACGVDFPVRSSCRFMRSYFPREPAFF